MNAAKASTTRRGNRANLAGTNCETTSMRRCRSLRAAAIEATSVIHRTISLTSSSAQIKPVLKKMRMAIWPTASNMSAPRRMTSAAFSAAVPQRSSRSTSPVEADKFSSRLTRRLLRAGLPDDSRRCAPAWFQTGTEEEFPFSPSRNWYQPWSRVMHRAHRRQERLC